MIPPRFAAAESERKVSKEGGTEKVHSYRICGLSVASDIALPGMIAATADSFAEVTIRKGEVPQMLPNATITGPTWQISGKQFLLSVPNVARFLLNDGQQIVFAPESDASAEDVPIFILGTVFGILLHQREQIVLHASAVEVNGRAVIFCGSSGAGKSTLAAALTQRGYRTISDDLCAMTLAADAVPIIHPDGRQLKLWAQAVEKLELEDIRREPVRGRLEKFYIELSETTSEALPLGAVYALREARSHNIPGIQRCNVVDAALLLRHHAYRPLLVARLEQGKHYFKAAAQIGNRSGIFLLTRPLEFTAMSDVISWLERHWDELDAAEKAA
jgi:hypothetical protein